MVNSEFVLPGDDQEGAGYFILEKQGPILSSHTKTGLVIRLIVLEKLG